MAAMRRGRRDLINAMLPDELMIEIFGPLEGSKSSRDACALVCHRWRSLERASRRSVRMGASGNADQLARLIINRFPSLCSIFVDERLPAALCPQIRLPGSPASSGRKPRARKALAKSGTDAHSTVLSSESEEMDSDRSSLSDAGLTIVARGCPKLEKLSLIWCSSITSLGLQSVADNCSILRSLDLQGCYVGDNGLIAIGQNCKQLEEVNLRFCEGLTDGGVVGLARGCGRTLKSLGIAACTWISDVALEAVGSHCRSLHVLSLDSEIIENRGMLAVARGCPALKILKLQCISATDDALEAIGSFSSSLELLALYSFQKFTDKGLTAIGEGCKRLKNLMLSDCYFLSDKSLLAIASGCTELTHLEINGCHNIGTVGVESIGKSCPRLLELDLLYCQRIGNNALFEVGKGCTRLQALQLVDCSGISDDAITSIALGCENLRKLHIRRCYEGQDDKIHSASVEIFSDPKEKQMEEGKFLSLLPLPLQGSSQARGSVPAWPAQNRWDHQIPIWGRSWLIGDKGIISVGEHCKHLVDLSLRFCDRVGDDALVAISKGCSLQSLNVSGCHKITDVGLTAIARGCPELVFLDVSVLQNLSDVALGEVGRGCPLLKDIVLSHCPQVTDTGLTHLANGCAQLQSCQMVYCPHITSAGVATVVSVCTCIKRVLIEKWKVSQRTRRKAASVLSFLCVDL